MDLTSTPTFWTEVDRPNFSVPALQQDASCEVAVIGSGITGAFAAFCFVQAGLDVLLVDRRELCTGSTSASTGLLQYELDTSLLDLITRMGQTDACRVYRAAEEALYKIEEIVSSLGDACGLTRKESLYLAKDGRETEAFRTETAARRACGILANYLTRGELRERFGIDRPCAILSPLALQVDPYLLAQRLLERAMARGVRAYGQTEIATYDAGDSSVTLRTSTGCQIRARRIVFATGYETPEFVKLNVRLKSTYALVSHPEVAGVEALSSCLLWESARPYLYARTAPGGRVIIGGEDIHSANPATRDALLPAKMEKLLAKFRLLFPNTNVAAHLGWAGTFAETEHGLPMIGTTPQFPLGFFALGYGGNGITFSLIAAEIIRDCLLRKAPMLMGLFPLNCSCAK